MSSPLWLGFMQISRHFDILAGEKWFPRLEKQALIQMHTSFANENVNNCFSFGVIKRF